MNRRYGISYDDIASYPYIFKVIRLLDKAETFIALPPGKIDFHYIIIALLSLVFTFRWVIKTIGC